MVNTLPSNNNWNHINRLLASFAVGAALATVAIVGGGEILGSDSGAGSLSSSTRGESTSIGVAMAEPDFGSVSVDYSAIRQSGRAGLQFVGPAMAELDFGSVAADYSAFRQAEAATLPDAAVVRSDQVLAVVDPHFGTGVESVSAIEGDYLQ